MNTACQYRKVSIKNIRLLKNRTHVIHVYMEEEKDRSVLALSDAYELEEFIPVKESSSDKDTTISDVAMLNNHLAVSNLALSQVRTIAGLCALSNAVCKLIEVRRKVKKLPYGEQSGGKGGRVFEVIE